MGCVQPFSKRLFLTRAHWLNDLLYTACSVLLAGVLGWWGRVDVRAIYSGSIRRRALASSHLSILDCHPPPERTATPRDRRDTRARRPARRLRVGSTGRNDRERSERFLCDARRERAAAAARGPVALGVDGRQRLSSAFVQTSVCRRLELP